MSVVTVLDKFSPHVDTIRDGLRPWREFASLVKPESFAYAGICNRLQVNLRYYRSNYAVGVLSFSVVAVALSPFSLAAICMLVLLWNKFLEKQEDPEWTVKFRGYELGRPKQWLLKFLSGAVLLYVAGKHVYAVLVASNFVLCHAMMHSSPESLTAPTAEPLTDSTDAVEALESGSAGAHDLVLYPAVD